MVLVVVYSCSLSPSRLHAVACRDTIAVDLLCGAVSLLLLLLLPLPLTPLQLELLALDDDEQLTRVAQQQHLTAHRSAAQRDKDTARQPSLLSLSLCSITSCV